MTPSGKRDPRKDAPVDDEQDVQGHGLALDGLGFDGLDDSGLAETQGPGRVRAIDDPRRNQQ